MSKRNKNSVLLAVIFTITIVAICVLIVTYSKADEPTTMYVVSAHNVSINVRHNPNTRSDIVGRLEFGWDVEVVESKKIKGVQWYKVNGISEYGYGWVIGYYLINSEPERVKDVKGMVNANGRVATYSKINSSRKSWAKPKETLDVSVYSDEWCYTNKGWIKTEYLAVDEKED